MAESGVIFDKSKELSLHLSRSQAKPFVHSSETNTSMFLDETGVSLEVVRRAPPRSPPSAQPLWIGKYWARCHTCAA